MAQAFKAKRLMGVCALMFGLIALSATAAQAEIGAFWQVEKAAVTEKLNAELQASLENNHGVLITKVGLAKVEILCTSIKTVDALLTVLGGARGKIHFAGCITLLKEKLEIKCKPHSPSATSGLIQTNTLDGLIKLHTGSVGLFELLPETGSVFVTIVLGIEGANECPIGEKFDITGKSFVSDCQGELSIEKVSHLVEEGPLSALKFGASAVEKIDGSAFLSLAGTHAGKTFSGFPH